MKKGEMIKFNLKVTVPVPTSKTPAKFQLIGKIPVIEEDPIPSIGEIIIAFFDENLSFDPRDYSSEEAGTNESTILKNVLMDIAGMGKKLEELSKEPKKNGEEIKNLLESIKKIKEEISFKNSSMKLAFDSNIDHLEKKINMVLEKEKA